MLEFWRNVSNLSMMYLHSNSPEYVTLKVGLLRYDIFLSPRLGLFLTALSAVWVSNKYIMIQYAFITLLVTLAFDPKCNLREDYIQLVPG